MHDYEYYAIAITTEVFCLSENKPDHPNGHRMCVGGGEGGVISPIWIEVNDCYSRLQGGMSSSNNTPASCDAQDAGRRQEGAVTGQRYRETSHWLWLARRYLVKL